VLLLLFVVSGLLSPVVVIKTVSTSSSIRSRFDPCCCSRWERRKLARKYWHLVGIGVCASFQAMTHLIVNKNDLCEESNFETMSDDAGTTEIFWNACDKSTTAYDVAPFGTIALWVVTSILICCIPCGGSIDQVRRLWSKGNRQRRQRGEKEEDADDQKPPT
jgi:hypothetical protein